MSTDDLSIVSNRNFADHRTGDNQYLTQFCLSRELAFWIELIDNDCMAQVVLCSFGQGFAFSLGKLQRLEKSFVGCHYD